MGVDGLLGGGGAEVYGNKIFCLHYADAQYFKDKVRSGWEQKNYCII